MSPQGCGSTDLRITMAIDEFWKAVSKAIVIINDRSMRQIHATIRLSMPPAG